MEVELSVFENTIDVRRRQVVTFLTTIASCLVMVSLVDAVIGPHEGWTGLAFDRVRLDSELSIAALFGFSLLLIAAALLALVALDTASSDPWRHHWWALALIFVLLAYDEAAGIHEMLIVPLRDRFGLADAYGGAFYFAWVIPGVVLAAALGLAFARFLCHLPSPFGLLFAAAGCLYVGGAIGMELVGGPLYEDRMAHYGTYYGVTVVEEGLEMAGVILFIDALLRLLETRTAGRTIRFRIGRSPTAADAAAGRGAQPVVAAPAANGSPASRSAPAPTVRRFAEPRAAVRPGGRARREA